MADETSSGGSGEEELEPRDATMSDLVALS